MPLTQNFLIYPDTHTPVQLWAPAFCSGVPLSLLSSFAVHPNTADGVYVNHTLSSSTHTAPDSTLLAFGCCCVLYAGRSATMALISHFSSHWLRTGVVMPVWPPDPDAGSQSVILARLAVARRREGPLCTLRRALQVPWPGQQTTSPSGHTAEMGHRVTWGADAQDCHSGLLVTETGDRGSEQPEPDT